MRVPVLVVLGSGFSVLGCRWSVVGSRLSVLGWFSVLGRGADELVNPLPRPPTTDHRQPTTDNRQPTTDTDPPSHTMRAAFTEQERTCAEIPRTTGWRTEAQSCS